jgi:hypothetical protein
MARKATRMPTIAADSSFTMVGGKPKPSPTMPQNPPAPTEKTTTPADGSLAVLAPVIADPLVHVGPPQVVHPVNTFKPQGALGGDGVKAAPGSGLHALRR